jgi:hypothetical protein
MKIQFLFGYLRLSPNITGTCGCQIMGLLDQALIDDQPSVREPNPTFDSWSHQISPLFHQISTFGGSIQFFIMALNRPVI